ncbi:MAG: nodulation protein NfeD [Dehalococcoidia bacterium]|nr:MAG: nodulation protein NfeD [Dehalococcoidia bacterium]
MWKQIFRFTYISFFLAGIILAVSGNGVNANGGDIRVLTVKGNIVPIVADYIDRGISRAEAEGSVACIIELDTPGGLLDVTQNIVTRILNAKVPVVVYVAPQGAWAASAGTFITLSAHITAMAPATSIGAAHPVGAQGETLSETALQKATEYTSAWIQSIADKRGRDAALVEAAVRESKSFTVTQAVDLKLVDFIADDLGSVVSQMNGRQVTLSDGRNVTLNTEGAAIIPDDMSGLEKFLLMISHPNVAYILLTLASIGLITEISNPGLIFPGVVGGLCLLLAFYSLGVLNAYWAGVLLILLAFGLFITEIFVPAYGILTSGGIISLVFGSLILFSGSDISMEFNQNLIIVVAVVMAIFVGLLVWAAVQGQRRKVTTGREGMVGQPAEVKTALKPRGMVQVEGELWTAELDNGTAHPGDQVIITRVDNLKLYVTKKK